MSKRYTSRSFKYDKIVYKSGLEVEVAKQLRKYRNKIDYKYECTTLPYTIEGLYVPDFQITKEDGTVLYIEAKGVLDRETQRKMLAVKRNNPDVVIFFLFQRNNPIRKKAKMRYGDWCDKHGFPWAVGTVPEEVLL